MENVSDALALSMSSTALTEHFRKRAVSTVSVRETAEESMGNLRQLDCVPSKQLCDSNQLEERNTILENKLRRAQASFSLGRMCSLSSIEKP